MQPHAGEAQIGGVVGGAHRALAGAIDDRPSSSSNSGNVEAGPSGAMQEADVRPVVVRAPAQLSTASQLLAGGVAGAFSKTCTAPLARLTILFQVRGMRADAGVMMRESPSIVRETKRIFKEEGFRAFWKGNGVTIIHRLPYSSVNFFAYEQYKMHLRRIMGIEGHQESLGVGMGTRLLAGGGAGITAASLTYPLDLVRTRLAAQTKEMYYKGISHALMTITRDEGFRGLYKGLGPTLMDICVKVGDHRNETLLGLSAIATRRYGVGRALLRKCEVSWVGFSDAQPTLAPVQGVGPNIAINFCVYETLKSMWMAKRPDMSPILVSLACGSFAGICSSTATFPIDLVRRRMQLEGAGGRAKVYKSGLTGIVKIIAKEEGGLFGLYRGIFPEYLKVIPSVGIVFMTYEFMKRILRPSAWDGL